MAVNWAMISRDERTPVPLPDEQVFLTQDNVTFQLTCGGGYPGHGGLSFKADGILYLTNFRIVFIAVPEQSGFKNISIPVRNLTDGHLVQPWFGPNSYQGVVLPVHGGGLNNMPGDMKITFKEGGGFEFSTMFSELLQRISERDSDAPVEHIEQLPMYTGPSPNSSITITTNIAPISNSSQSQSTNDATITPLGPSPIDSRRTSTLSMATSFSNTSHTRNSSLPTASPITPESENLIAEALNSHISSTNRKVPDEACIKEADDQDLPTDMPPSYDDIVGKRS